jgi:hypothetical protein
VRNGQLTIFAGVLISFFDEYGSILVIGKLLTPSSDSHALVFIACVQGDVPEYETYSALVAGSVASATLVVSETSIIFSPVQKIWP